MAELEASSKQLPTEKIISHVDIECLRQTSEDEALGCFIEKVCEAIEKRIAEDLEVASKEYGV